MKEEIDASITIVGNGLSVPVLDKGYEFHKVQGGRGRGMRGWREGGREGGIAIPIVDVLKVMDLSELYVVPPLVHHWIKGSVVIFIKGDKDVVYLCMHLSWRGRRRG